MSHVKIESANCLVLSMSWNDLNTASDKNQHMASVHHFNIHLTVLSSVWKTKYKLSGCQDPRFPSTTFPKASHCLRQPGKQHTWPFLWCHRKWDSSDQAALSLPHFLGPLLINTSFSFFNFEDKRSTCPPTNSCHDEEKISVIHFTSHWS